MDLAHITLLKIVALAGFAIEALLLPTLLVTTELFFYRLRKKHGAYHKSVGRPSLLPAYLSGTITTEWASLKYINNFPLKGYPKGLPKDTSLRQLVRILQQAGLVCALLFIPVVVLSFFAFQ